MVLGPGCSAAAGQAPSSKAAAFDCANTSFDMQQSKNCPGFIFFVCFGVRVAFYLDRHPGQAQCDPAREPAGFCGGAGMSPRLAGLDFLPNTKIKC